MQRNNKESANNAVLEMASKLIHGDTCVIFGESVWNLHPMLPMLNLKTGGAKMAAISQKPIMDKIGTQTDESIHAKSLIWFVAAILHSLLFTGTKDLRVSDRKTFTVPSVVDLLEEINSDKNLMTSQYERRYKPNRKQSDILKALGISTTDIDDRISVL